MNVLNCKEVTTRRAMGDLSQFSFIERLTIRFHMAICYVCRRYERQINAIAGAWRLSMGRKLEASSTADLKARLLHDIRKR